MINANAQKISISTERLTASPEEVGICSSRLERINDLTSSYINQGKLVGTISAVSRRNQLVHIQCSGQMDLETGRPMQEDAIFRIYSMTKPVTSIALMILYERGHFQLDTPISNFIPEFKNPLVFVGGTVDEPITENAKREITIRDLLTQTSGLTYGLFSATPVDQMYARAGINVEHNEDTVGDLVRRVAKIPLLFSPGTQWCYSVATDVLGHLIEIITGQPLDKFFQKEILDPLGMVDTSFYVPVSKQDRFTTNYLDRSAMPPEQAEEHPDQQLFLMDDPRTGYYSKPPKKLMGGGGLVSTVSDYMKFASMLFNKGRSGNAQLVSPKTIELMTSNHLNGDLKSMCFPGGSGFDLPGIGFGLGFGVMLDPAKANNLGTPGEFYWGGAAHTTFFVDPKEELVAMMFTQVFPPMLYDTDLEFKRAVYQAIID